MIFYKYKGVDSMTNNELLLSMSNLLDAKLKPLNDTVNKIDTTINEDVLPRIQNLETTVNDEVLPRIQNLETTVNDEVLPRILNLETTVNDEVLPRIQRLETTVNDEMLPRIQRLETTVNDVMFPRFLKLETFINKDIGPKIIQIEFSIKKIEVTNENKILPRLNTIESCYLSTFERYKKGIEQLDSMQVDVDVLKNVVQKHSHQLQMIS